MHAVEPFLELERLNNWYELDEQTEKGWDGSSQSRRGEEMRPNESQDLFPGISSSDVL